MQSQLRPFEPLAPPQRLPQKTRVDRDAFLLELCRGKRVLHLACAAWPATEMWCRDGSLLHLRLAEVTSQLAGFDWSEPGLAVLREFGARDLYQLNLLQAGEVAKAWSQLDFAPEIVLAGELLEHLDRPGLVLENCRVQMPAASRLIITVPNAFSVHSLLHVLRGYEKVAPDHVSYYSYANVRELAARNGFQLDQLTWYRYSPPRNAIDQLVDLAVSPLLWIWPQLAEGLIAECTLSDVDSRQAE